MHTTLVDSPVLRSHLDDNDWLILDCRFALQDVGAGRRSYAEGHIPGALYLHLDDDLSSPITPDSGRHPLPDVARLADKLNSIGCNPLDQVVAYDDMGGAMAVRIWWLLRWLGHRSVALLDGGWQGWLDHGGAVQLDTPTARPAGRFTPHVQPGFITSTQDVLASLASVGPASLLLVDARSQERFRGESEPIDPVAGRIPGALNRPLGDNLAAGYFKSPATLRAEWTAIFSGAAPGLSACGPADADPARVVHYCGSGVTAVHNQLAMEIAGLSGSRLYPGSWSEWIRNPARPVATGE